MPDITRREFNKLLGAAALSASMTSPTPAPEAICDLTAVELASRIKKRQLSAREVVTAHLARIERVNPKVNAIVTLVAERAMADAAKADEAQAKGQRGCIHKESSGFTLDRTTLRRALP